MLGIPNSGYCDRYARWVAGGVNALADRSSPRPRSVWNRSPDTVRKAFVDFALDREDPTPRELAVEYTDGKRCFVSEASAYHRILKAEDPIAVPAHVAIRAADEFRDKTTRPNEFWQTDFTYLNLSQGHWLGLGLPRHNPRRLQPPHRRLEASRDDEGRGCHRHAGPGVGGLGLRSGRDRATVARKPRSLSDTGSSDVAADLAEYLDDKGMDHVRGAPHRPRTQGKIERWHRTTKNPLLLENYFPPDDLERQIGAGVDRYTNRRYRESLSDLTPADLYRGRSAKSPTMSEKIEKQRLQKRRLRHKAPAA